VDQAHPVYELDMWLVDSQPLVWRSLAAPADFTLADLHDLIQIVMEWDEEHMHHFQTKDGRLFEPGASEYVNPFAEIFAELGVESRRPKDEAAVTLRDVFDELKNKFVYEYDFGDSWLHGIKLIQTHADASAFAHLPICLAGAMAGPPEDCGGVWGYTEKLEILRNPDSNEDWHQEMIEWFGDDFDPRVFDIAAKNHRIAAAWGKRTPKPSNRKRRH